MRLDLFRFWYTDESTIGALFIDGRFQCFTLEDPWRPEGIKVYGNTAISAGVYRVAITFSNRFRRMLPLVIDVPNFTGIRFHSGNAPEDTEGCILPGMEVRENWVGRSRAAFDALFETLQSTTERITLVIHDFAH